MMDCWTPTQIIVLIILSVVAVPVLMSLGVFVWLMLNMLRGRGGWK